MTEWLSREPQNERRERWFRAVRDRLHEVIGEDGTGRMPQFNAPWREPVWILPALYTGPGEFAELANRMVERYAQAPEAEYKDLGTHSGMEWNIFQSNAFSHCLHRFGGLLSPGARDVMTWHARETCRTYRGSGQHDYRFHGANDNMPTMGTYGMIFAGEALDLPEAVDHGLWNLQEVRRLLSRSAWMSEFNSSTYSAITLTGMAKLASYARTSEVRELALDIEHRLWAEVLLHFHPATFMQAGPQCRAYAIDYAGHTHTLQAVLWMAFGDAVGRDPIRSYFEPDGREVLHFAGNPWQSIAEFCDALDAELHVPADLAPLVSGRTYPAVLRGRGEAMGRFDGMSAPYHTETYMEEAFSLGTVNGPLCGGEQTATCYVTYKRKADVQDFRGAATVFFKYLDSEAAPVALETSADGGCESEAFVHNASWWYSLQKRNTALLLTTPNLKHFPRETRSLRLSVVFPAHYGRITRSIVGKEPARDGAVGASADVVPVSVETGEVFLHLQPLLPTSLPRGAAVRFRSYTEDRESPMPYEVLDLVNYEGPARAFSREDAARVLNGMVLTVAARGDDPDLETFHRRHSELLVRDSFAMGHRYLLVQREDVEFDVLLTTDPFGVQTEAIDGRTVPRPVLESNQLDPARLPFTTGPVPRSRPFFPWKTLDMCWYPDAPWLIGSRGLPGEAPYSRPEASGLRGGNEQGKHDHG